MDEKEFVKVLHDIDVKLARIETQTGAWQSETDRRVGRLESDLRTELAVRVSIPTCHEHRQRIESEIATMKALITSEVATIRTQISGAQAAVKMDAKWWLERIMGLAPWVTIIFMLVREAK